MIRIALTVFAVWLSLGSMAQSQESMPAGLFVSMIEQSPVLSNRNDINNLVAYAKKARIKTLYVQIYRANKSYFPSKIADQSPYDHALKIVGEDPLAVLITKAHKAGIKVHAWLNLLSLSTNADAPILRKFGPSILTRNLDPKKSLEDYKIDNQYFLEPGDPRVRAYLVKLIEEIVRRYPAFDGIQFDYIRYPDVHPQYGYTKLNVDRFKKFKHQKNVVEGSDIWKQWKRDQVTELLTMLIKRVHAFYPDMKVSTTGCVSFVRAYEEAFQDWPSWVDSGLVDFVTVMDYPPDVETYEKNMADAKAHVKDFKKVNMAVGAYKFIKTPEVFAAQYKACAASGARSCAVFYYGNLLENPALADILVNRDKSL